MSRSTRRTLLAAACAAPLAILACSKSTEAPTIPAIHVHPYSGDAQVGPVGWAVNLRPIVRVTDSVGNAIHGAVVTFAISAGGGSATSTSTTTDLTGLAQVGSWTLGAAPGINSMTATVTQTGFSDGQYVFTDTAVTPQFTIQLQYYGNYKPTAAESAAFNAAIAKWQQIVYRHIDTPGLVSDSANTCEAGDPALTNVSVTDVLILASFDSIDGPNKTLAEASPCLARTDGQSAGLPVLGIIKFDTADVGTLVSGGQLNAVVEHEMGHVLGFGTLWSLGAPFPVVNCLQLPSNPGGTLNDTYFSCVGGTRYAAAAFDSVGGTSYTGAGQTFGSPVHVPPVENCANSPYVYPTCGGGTINGHWRQTVFGNELMVGFLPSSPALSRVTAASLQDLGYSVNYAATDPYSHAFTAPPAAGAGARVNLGDDIHHGPLYGIDRTGHIKLVTKRQ